MNEAQAIPQMTTNELFKLILSLSSIRQQAKKNETEREGERERTCGSTKQEEEEST